MSCRTPVRQYPQKEQPAGSRYQRRGHATGVLQMGVTLDGYVHGAKGYEDWRLPPEEEAVVAWKVESLRQAGTHIMGRLTYEAMAAVWPTADGVFADVMNEISKVVFSTTLTHADWEQTRIANGVLVEDIDRLKREAGGPILAHGGATFSTHSYEPG